MKRKKSFLTTMNMMIICSVSIAVILISSLFSTYLYQMAESSTMDMLTRNLNEVNQEVTDYVEECEKALNQLATDVELGRSVDALGSENLLEVTDARKMVDYIVRNIMALNLQIENITIYSSQEILQYNQYSLKKGNDEKKISDAQWYQKLLSGEKNMVFERSTVYDTDEMNNIYFLMATKFKNKIFVDRKDEDRILIITFRMKELEKIISATGERQKINILLYNNEDKEILVSSGIDDSYQEITQKWEKGEIGDLSDFSSRFVILEDENTKTGWKVMGFIEKTALIKMNSFIPPLFIGIIVFVLAAVVFMSVIIFRSLSKPMKDVIQGMEGVGNQEFRTLKMNSQYKEIDQLVSTYNQMTVRIQDLILSIEVKEREKRREEYRVLEAQINPHFIYNTLEAIRWVALMNNSKPTAEIISSFVKFLRISLSQGRELLTVKEEIELTREYINIMFFRNNYNIDVQWEVSEAAEMLYTLKLVLQPFVENCFVHAFDGKGKNQKICIRAYRQEQFLIMEVEDNGKGIGKEAASNTNVLTGVGIHNIDERIKIWHGEEYGVHMIPLEQGGTMIRILEPVIEE